MRGKTLMVVRVLGVLLLCGAAAAELRFDEGRWRVEMSGWGGVDGRKGDCLATGTVDYEIPATPRLTLGLRLMPLFVYAQDVEGNGWCARGEDDDTVWGGGGGLTLRLYQVPEERRGLFGEIQANAFAQKNRFDGNGSSINFLSGVGLGYQFRNDWHAVVKFAHISNAHLDDDNPEINLVGLGIGYTF